MNLDRKSILQYSWVASSNPAALFPIFKTKIGHFFISLEHNHVQEQVTMAFL